ncbi:uncharacterized protein [Cardiocondyla obscurior]|uniref:uncharacterized protein n=1 Tax=Cardiocondyla obscurior TaxID=286306 RepID=UPI003965601D
MNILACSSRVFCVLCLENWAAYSRIMDFVKGISPTLHDQSLDASSTYILFYLRGERRRTDGRMIKASPRKTENVHQRISYVFPIPSTAVSDRHRQNCMTPLKLMQINWS